MKGKSIQISRFFLAFFRCVFQSDFGLIPSKAPRGGDHRRPPQSFAFLSEDCETNSRSYYSGGTQYYVARFPSEIDRNKKGLQE